MGFEDEHSEEGLAKECKQLLEAEQGKEIDSPLDLQEDLTLPTS